MEPKDIYRTITIYFDADDNLIGVPYTRIPPNNWDVGISNIVCLSAPYQCAELGRFILDVFDRCHSIQLTELPKVGALAEFLGVKTHKTAVKGKGSVQITWYFERGYTVYPTWKNAKMKHMFCFMMDEQITISLSCKGDALAPALADAFLQAKQISPIEPLNEPPKL